MKTPNAKKIKVISALGRPVTKSVNTPDAQQEENAIPNPNIIPPRIKPKLMGLIHKL